MRKFAAAALFATLALLAGCGDPHGELVDEAIGVAKEMPAILATIKDPASAKAAGEKIKALGTRFKDIKTRGDALPKISSEKKKELDKRLQTALAEIKPQMEAELEKITKENPFLLLPLMPALQELKDTFPQ